MIMILSWRLLTPIKLIFRYSSIDTQTQLLIIRTLTGVSCLMTTWPWPMSPLVRVWWRWWSEMRLPSEWWDTPWCPDFSLQSSGVTRPTLLWDILDNLSNISLYPGLCDVAPSSLQHHHSIHCSLIHEHEHLQETCLGRDVDHDLRWSMLCFSCPEPLSEDLRRKTWEEEKWGQNYLCEQHFWVMCVQAGKNISSDSCHLHLLSFSQDPAQSAGDPRISSWTHPWCSPCLPPPPHHQLQCQLPSLLLGWASPIICTYHVS